MKETIKKSPSISQHFRQPTTTGRPMFDKSEINISRVPLGTLVQEKIRTTEAWPGWVQGFHSQDSPKMDGLYILRKWRIPIQNGGIFLVFFDMMMALTNYQNRKQLLATISNSQHYC
jgi:hypothetical protein